MAYKGKYTVKNTDKYLGDFNKVTYRSLWERNVMRWIETNNDILKWSSEVKINYINDLDGKPHRYYVDLYLEFSDGTKKIVEIKPKKYCSIPPKPKKITQRYINECATFVTNSSKWKYAEQIAKQNGLIFEIWDEYYIKSLGITILT